MGYAIVLQLCSTEREGAGRDVVEVEMTAEAANNEGLQTNPRPEHQDLPIGHPLRTGEEETPELGRDVPASVIGHRHTSVEVAENTRRHLRMVEIQDLEALP